ncbi:MAG: DNA methyltransferase [Desulfuromonadaceae bacterium]|nr:DNA methyltransferase [Desulfuromonadaceae bacterium]MDD2856000.1 DNA methyltransferase [Desulfuromonadaceae bacterium]
MKQEKLFKTEMIPGKAGSGNLFQEQLVPNSSPITCLGIAFENDEARRAHFAEELRKKLHDPEFRKIEGFPIGTDDDILALSDPPYYTACPNPWIADFIAEWEAQKPVKPEGYSYHREPFAADVSEGKNDPIYNAHSYHTKVPHKAIMRYILHYTEPGDIVFDGFCGTGMTGVAAQMCGDRNVVMELGYQVKPDGTILQEETDDDGKKKWVAFSNLGVRRAVLNDLSPAATFIAYNYNTPVNPLAFEKEAYRILAEVEKECGWMYETKHTDNRTGKINYTVWSDVFVCPECAREVVFWEEAVDAENGKVLDEFPCPHCTAELTKRRLDRSWHSKYDSAIGETVKQAKQVPVLINYSVSGISGRFEKKPDTNDLALINKIENDEISCWYPSNRMIEGRETRRNDPIGITHVHHFYTKRNLRVLATLRYLLSTSEMESQLLCLVGDQLPRASKMHKIAVSRLNTNLSKTAGVLAGTLYIPSNQIEYCLIAMIGFRIKDISSYQSKRDHVTKQVVFTSSSEDVLMPDSSLDYFFFDPPFGANINYSELNSLWEVWLKVITNNKPEAIENSAQGKNLDNYRQLMSGCFKEAYRMLKPGRWLTVEFSNTNASVWNSIQTALTEVGFIVANVSALDKKQGSFKAVTTPTAVKQDLVISVYKPNGGFEERFQNEAETEEGVWDFIRTHLKYLPVTKRQGVLLQMVPERDPRILFDQLVAYYVRKGYPIPISSQEFQIELAQRFIERDGMYFLTDQVAEYDRKKMLSGEVAQASLFVFDEASAIQWLRQLIKDKPQTFSDINPQFMQQLGGWSKNEAQLDLRELLNQSFLCYDGKGLVPEQIHTYLSSNWKELRNLPKDDPALVAKARDRWYVPDPNKAGDLEKLREKALLKEFEEYKQAKKKLKVFRLEAVRVGFKNLWQQKTDDAYRTIVEVAEKIPNNVLEEDAKLLMWYDQALTRTSRSEGSMT